MHELYLSRLCLDAWADTRAARRGHERAARCARARVRYGSPTARAYVPYNMHMHNMCMCMCMCMLVKAKRVTHTHIITFFACREMQESYTVHIT